MSEFDSAELALKETLEALGDGVKDLVLVGGWVPYLYTRHLWKTPTADFPLTTDIDLGVRETGSRPHDVTLFQRLSQAGLAMKRIHPKEETPVQFAHKKGRSTVKIDFITSEYTSDDTWNRFLGKDLSWSRITAFELLLESPIPVDILLKGKTFPLNLPAPARFFLHKGIIFSLRNGEFKRAKDLYTFFWGLRFAPDPEAFLNALLAFKDHEYFAYFRDNIRDNLSDPSQRKAVQAEARAVIAVADSHSEQLVNLQMKHAANVAGFDDLIEAVKREMGKPDGTA